MQAHPTHPVQQVKQYECTKCNDIGFIISDNNYARKCECLEVKRNKKILQASGISEAFLTKTFDNYEAINSATANAKETAKRYSDEFEDIRVTKNNSIALLGQVGSGKTHLSIAIANELMSRGIAVSYMQYREAISVIKQVITDEASYEREMKRFKQAPVLLIDDLYKGMLRQGRINESDLNIMFEIINHRYLKSLPVIVSSEFRIDRIFEFDEAIGSRIIEMCRGNIVELDGAELNYRIR